MWIWIVLFVSLAGATVIAGTVIFLLIYKETARAASNIRRSITDVISVTENDVRRTHQPSFDVEAYIRDRAFLSWGAALVAAPFLHDRRAIVGFYLYIAGALFGAVAAILSVVPQGHR
jgi:hypothetical protein